MARRLPRLGAALLAAAAACTTTGAWAPYPEEHDVPVELALRLTLASLSERLAREEISFVCLGRLGTRAALPPDHPGQIWHRRMLERLRGMSPPVVDASGCGALAGAYVLRSNDARAAHLTVSPLDPRADGSAARPYRTRIAVELYSQRRMGNFRIGYTFSRDPDGWWIDGVWCQGPEEPCERVRTTMPLGPTPGLRDAPAPGDTTAPGERGAANPRHPLRVLRPSG
jgi:hypothetical protein